MLVVGASVSGIRHSPVCRSRCPVKISLRDKFDRLPSISSGGSDSGAVDLFYNHTEGPLVSAPRSVRH